MLTRWYLYTCANWQALLAVLVVSMAMVASIATQLQVFPHPIYVAVNWDERITK